MLMNGSKSKLMDNKSKWMNDLNRLIRAYNKTTPDTKANKVTTLKRFMTMCCNRTTEFTKCEYCEFRFKCYTEVTKRKNANNNKQQKRKTPKKKVPDLLKPYRRRIVGRIK